jgi:hypothetical protein
MIGDATELKSFDLIRLPYTYADERPELKRFVFIRHEAGYAICLKATSKVILYLNDPTLMAGVIFYQKNSLAMFELDTVIQPDNPHPLSHIEINRSIKQGTFEHLGAMPEDFRAALLNAINASKTMKPERKRNLLARL